MKKILTVLVATTFSAMGEGFSDADIVFYGEVRQVGGGSTTLLQSGELEITFVHPSDPANVVTIETQLRPTGSGASKNFSYSLKVPLLFLPNYIQKSKALSVGAEAVSFQVRDITVDGRTATMPDGSMEFLPIGFSDRSSQYQLDLIVEGESLDLDGDELPDWWESMYGITSPSDDPDADGWDNATEYRLGSDPTVSNRVTSLATSQVLVPESGKAGFMLDFLDSDTPAAEILVELESDGSAFEILLDDAPINELVTAADFKNGRITVSQNDSSQRSASVVVTWQEGSGEVTLRANLPSATNGTDASLWLDGETLPLDGELVGIWADRSGGDNSASQPLEGSRPKVTDRSVDFSSANSHLFFRDSVLPVGDHTIFAAYENVSGSDDAQTIFASNRGHFKLAPTTRAISYPGAPVYQMNGVAVTGYEASDGRSIFRAEGSVLQNIFGHSYDGESSQVLAIEPALPTLGATRPVEGSVIESFSGKLQELLVFPAALPEQKLREVSDYLDSKWGEAVVWDLSTEIRMITLRGSSQGSNIMRGGLGSDSLAGGPLGDTLSGGPGNDVLTGGEGRDQFVYGQIDTGNDRITDFSEEDVLDLSALFWGETGDARDHISTRLQANFATEIPTLDTVLTVGGSLEITLENVVIQSDSLIQMIIEGRIRMGSLSIPTDLSLVKNFDEVIQENESFEIVLTRSGDGVPAALEVSMGFLKEAVGSDFEVEGQDGQRAVISFARGETTKIITVRALPDTLLEGTEEWEMKLLPNYRYEISGASVLQQVADFLGTKFDMWLAIETDFSDRDEVPKDQLSELIHQYIGDDFNLDFRMAGDRPQFKLSGVTPDDVEWRISESETMEEWEEITGEFTMEEAEKLMTFLGAPRTSQRKFYQLTPALKTDSATPVQ